MTEFELLVSELRTTQKRYFRLREPADLAQAKDLERRVDEQLKLQKQNDRAQPGLFDQRSDNEK